jgi:NitT/TauT family transport system permease protein
MWAIISLLAVWTFISFYVHNDYLVPSIAKVGTQLYIILSGPENIEALFYSLMQLLLAIFVSFGIAFMISILEIISDKTYLFIKPFLTVIKTVPLVSIIIIVLVWFGIEQAPILITMLVVLPVATEGLRTGTAHIAKLVGDELKLMENNWLVIIPRLYLPMLGPYILMSFVQTFGLGLKVLIMAELVCQTSKGIGNMMYMARINVETPTIFAWSVLIIVIVMLFESLFSHINEKVKEYI